MKISGLGLAHLIDEATGEVIGTRIKHNTNTDFGKQLILLKTNHDGIGTFNTPIPASISSDSGVIDSYQINMFAVGATAGAAAGDSSLTSLLSLIPMKLVGDATATAGIYFAPTAADTNTTDNLITDSNYSEYASSTKDDFYWKLIDSTTYESVDSIKYVLRLESSDIKSQNASDKVININEFGLYASPTSDDGNGVITVTEDTPKILFARLIESYDKTESMGIILEWIITVT